MRRADVVIGSRLGELDFLRLPLAQRTGVPISLSVGGRGMRGIAEIGKGDGGSGLWPASLASLA